MDKILYSMKLGERYRPDNALTIIRVPGGWLFVIFSLSAGSNTSAFVPFSNEFQLASCDLV